MGEEQDRVAKRRRNRKRRVIAYGSIGALLVGFYYYQPNRIDFIPRHVPVPNPRVDPDSASLFKKGTRVAIVTAHPDDAEFFLGGTLTRLGAAGVDITLIVCTNGDKSFYPGKTARSSAVSARASSVRPSTVGTAPGSFFSATPTAACTRTTT